MTSLAYTPRARDDLDRLADFLLDTDPAAAGSTQALIVDALEILARHPLVGRRTQSGRRELVISRGHTGYLALYEYDERHDQVVILTVRHQREAGFED
ncbi:MAG TPA: type II toxin-antitoxin system RelE/ParE family toxin [Usitatibacter sp.]|nr:type II toxin-antitoxin system RelE/ParE family toxin [Usitatibacter sp.]